MKIKKKPLGTEGALFAVEGELDAYTGPQLREDLGQAVTEGVRFLVLDMSAVQYIDSVGLGILVGAVKRTHEQQGGLAVIKPQANVLRVFEVSGTKDLLNVVGSLEEARSHLKGLPPDDGEGE